MSKKGFVSGREVQLFEGRQLSHHKDAALMAKIIKEMGICYYLANVLVYFVSSNRRDQKIKELNKAITYLEKLHKPQAEQKPDIWNHQTAHCIGSTFKGLSEIVKCEHQPEDIEKALTCLYVFSDLIRDKCEFF